MQKSDFFLQNLFSYQQKRDNNGTNANAFVLVGLFLFKTHHHVGIYRIESYICYQNLSCSYRSVHLLSVYDYCAKTRRPSTHHWIRIVSN